MTVTKYDGLRIVAAQDNFDWVNDECSASLVLPGYTPNFATDRDTLALGLTFLQTIPVTNAVVDPAGWLKSDALYFPDVVTDQIIAQVMMWRNVDRLPLLLLAFPPVAPVPPPQARAYYVLLGRSKPGFTRL